MKKIRTKLILCLGLFVLSSNSCNAKTPSLTRPFITQVQPAALPNQASVQPEPHGVGAPPALATLALVALPAEEGNGQEEAGVEAAPGHEENLVAALIVLNHEGPQNEQLQEAMEHLAALPGQQQLPAFWVAFAQLGLFQGQPNNENP